MKAHDINGFISVHYSLIFEQNKKPFWTDQAGVRGTSRDSAPVSTPPNFPHSVSLCAELNENAGRKLNVYKGARKRRTERKVES
jgi:hypothetical protein